MFASGYFKTIWWFEVISSHDVVDVVDTSRSHSDFGEIDRPYTTVSIFSLILRKIRCIDMIMDISR